MHELEHLPNVIASLAQGNEFMSVHGGLLRLDKCSCVVLEFSSLF